MAESFYAMFKIACLTEAFHPFGASFCISKLIEKGKGFIIQPLQIIYSNSFFRFSEILLGIYFIRQGLLKSPTSKPCPWWLIFFKNLFYRKNCKEAMNIEGGQIRCALFNFFVVKKCPFCIFQMLPSVSTITPVRCTLFYWCNNISIILCIQ